MAKQRQRIRSGLHAALQLAVNYLRGDEELNRNSRLVVAQVLRDFLGQKRLTSKLSMRKVRNAKPKKAVPIRGALSPEANQGLERERHHAAQ
jgi:hypothetical protein